MESNTKTIKHFYICDRTLYRECNPRCRHTSCVARAKYKSVPGTDNEIASFSTGGQFKRTFKECNRHIDSEIGYFEVDPITGKV